MRVNVIEPELDALSKVYPTENPDGTVELLVGVTDENTGAVTARFKLNATIILASASLPTPLESPSRSIVCAEAARFSIVISAFGDTSVPS